MLSLLLALSLTAQPLAPPEAKARLQNLEQQLEDWDLEGAKAELQALKQLVPEGLETVAYYEGRIAFEEGRYADAVKFFEQAPKQGAMSTELKLAQDTLAVTKNHKRIESEHFVFLYPPGKDEILAPWALEALESIRTAMEQDLGWAPKEKVRIVVVQNAGELAKVSTLTKDAIKTTGTIAICKFNKLMVTTPRAVFHGYDWLDTLAHEYIHYVVAHKSRNTVPIWLHEGLAKFLESRWRGPAGGAMTPSTLALLGKRVREKNLVPFSKMHPSMALLPTAEDAATAFAEVFFAMDLLHKKAGAKGMEKVLSQMATGVSDKQAVGEAFGSDWAGFEKAWMAHLSQQPFPKELIPKDSAEQKRLVEGKEPKDAKKKGREVSFGDFVEVKEPEARKWAHLGELMRERQRTGAAAEHFGKAHALVSDRYESVSNKYALALIELRRLEEAEKVLLGSAAVHPGSAQTHVHLGRVALLKRDWAKARKAFEGAVAVDPMDEEIHLALLMTAREQKDDAMANRARKALAVLFNRPEKDVDAVADQVWRDVFASPEKAPSTAAALPVNSAADAGPGVR